MGDNPGGDQLTGSAGTFAGFRLRDWVTFDDGAGSTQRFRITGISVDTTTLTTDKSDLTPVTGDGNEFIYTTLDGAESIKEALYALPSRVVDNIEITTEARTHTEHRYRITFFSEYNKGDISLMQCNSEGCDIDGCQPRYEGLSSASGTVTCTITEVRRGTHEQVACSNRGNCNTETGECKCFNGFAGHDCSKFLEYS